MRIYLILILFIISVNVRVYSQSRAELEEKRNDAIKDIEYIDRLIKSTNEERNQNINQLNVVNRKLSLREDIIKGIEEEKELISNRILLNIIAVEMMEEDLDLLVKQYEQAILQAQKASKGNPDFAYILSAKDLNQGYKRMKYLQQIAKFRRREAEVIMSLKDEVQRNKNKLEADFSKIAELEEKEVQQKRNLQSEQLNKRRIVQNLQTKEKELQKELEEKRKITKEIEKEIERVIEEERKRRAASDLTPEEELVGDDFANNRGKLPWPVQRGVITGKYGVHDHPVIKGAKVDNIGIEITSSSNEIARSVFNGEVMSVFGISGGNMAVIIRHGRYLSVYQNLVNVIVKPGDKVQTKQKIGDVYNDEDKDEKCIIKFMIYNEKDKQNPESWLAKKQ